MADAGVTVSVGSAASVATDTGADGVGNAWVVVTTFVVAAVMDSSGGDVVVNVGDGAGVHGVTGGGI